MASVFTLVLFWSGGSHAQWVQQVSGTTARLTDVVMLDSLTALCVGDSGKILKTTNAGITWLTKYSGLQRWNEIAFVNQSTGIVVGNRMAGAVTSDGGETWAAWTLIGPTNLLTVAVVGMVSVFIGTDSGNVLYSHDGGRTWNQFRLPTGPINSIFGGRGDFAPVDMYAVTPWRAYKSSNLGAAWTAQTLPITIWGSALRGALTPGRNAFIVGYDGQPGGVPIILRRTPLDSAWVKFIFMPPVLPRIARDVSASTNEVAFACGSLGVMFKTIDGGNFWTYHNSGTQKNLNAIHFLNARRGFAVGDSGTILFTPNGGASTNRPPQAFHLLRPANGDTMPVPRSITFAWQRAIDPDNDSVRYSLVLSSDGGATWRTMGTMADTTLQVQTVQAPDTYLWTVIATDGQVSVPSLDIFRFTIRSTSNVEAGGKKAPDEFVLYQNYPNPFNPSTEIRFQIAEVRGQKSEVGRVTLKVYDLLGREVATLVNEVKAAGIHVVQFDASNLPSGVYFYRLQTERYVQTKTMIVLR